ncbi:MAG: hypothetical protein JXN64_13205 [Spirochaetes bacterium]|nr:hypothetical protein [Spirochaetota bacterium]
MIHKSKNSILVMIQAITVISLLCFMNRAIGNAVITKPLPSMKIFRCSGIVNDEAGNPMAQVNIKLYTRPFSNQPWQLKSSVYTNEDGSYIIGYTGTSIEDLLGETEFLITATFGPAKSSHVFHDWGFSHSWDTLLDPTQLWWKVTYSSPSSVLSLLNNGYRGRPLVQAKVTAEWKNNSMFFEVYNILGPAESVNSEWTYAHYNHPENVLNLLNGVSPADDPICRPMICALYKDNIVDFYIFFRDAEREPGIQWDMRAYGSYTAVLNWINGDPLYKYRRKPVGAIEICSVSFTDSDNDVYYYAFGQIATSRQLRDIWTVKEFTSSSGILNIINNPGQLVRPIYDGKNISLSGTGKYTVFVPQGLVIVTRPMFENCFQNYALWKLKHGFETTVVTADWINSTFSGADLRHKVRNCLREYYYSNGARFAMLVGDSKDGEDTQGLPGETNLNYSWNLPAGYYIREQDANVPIYTSAFFADLTDKEYYSKYENLFTGDFAIKVGIVPVRTVPELNNVLYKSMNYDPALEMHYIFSYDLVNEHTDQYISNVENVIETYSLSYNYNYTYTTEIFEANSLQHEVFDAVFNNTGVLDIHAHGNLYEIIPGNVHVSFMDAYRFQYVNPLYISASCGINNYMKGNSLSEYFLKAAKGPAVIVIPPLSSYRTVFWDTLFQGYSIGEAFYHDVDGASPSYWQLLGDPSLVMIDLNW